jgi:hypothetical protein
VSSLRKSEFIKNITLSADEELIEAARAQAKQEGLGPSLRATA